MISNIQDLISAFGSLVNLLLPLSVAVALLFFFWSLAIFIKESDDVKKKQEGKNKMVWGIVVLFVMVSIWGIVRFIQEDVIFLIGGNAPSQLNPKVNN